MSTLVRLRSFIVPASLALILALAAGWYHFFWLPSEHRYLDDRNFRVLKTLSDQIRLSINNFDRMLDDAADSGITGTLKDYLSNVAPQLETPEYGESKPVIGTGSLFLTPKTAAGLHLSCAPEEDYLNLSST
jgi:hypothetical protein